MNKQLGLAAVVAAILAPLGAHGQTTSQQFTDWWSYQPKTYEPSAWWDDRWYVTPFAGFLATDSRHHAENGVEAGVAVGRPLSPAFNVELRGFYDHAAGKDGPTLKAYGATVDGLWFFQRRYGYDNWNQPQPYVVAGVGAAKDDWRFVANAGAGMVWRVADWGRVVGDVRYRYTNHNPSFNDWIFTIGLQIPLGAPPRVAEAPRPAPPPPAPRVEPPPPPPPPPPPRPQATSRTFTLAGDGLFEFDRADLTAAGRTRVDEIVRTARGAGFTATSIALTGYTDPLGSTKYNQALSERRAATVRDYLVSQGVSASIITAEGRGEQNLKVTEADCRARGEAKTRKALIACLAPDRRVEAVITGTQIAP